MQQSMLQGLVGYNCRRAYLTIHAVFLERMAQYRLRPVDYSVLALIAANRDVTLKRLSQALNISPPNLAVLLDKLEERDLLARLPNPQDKRSQFLHLTATGKALLRKAEKTVERLELDATDVLSDAERTQLIGLLRKLYRAG